MPGHRLRFRTALNQHRVNVSSWGTPAVYVASAAADLQSQKAVSAHLESAF